MDARCPGTPYRGARETPRTLSRAPALPGGDRCHRRRGVRAGLPPHRADGRWLGTRGRVDDRHHVFALRERARGAPALAAARARGGVDRGDRADAPAASPLLCRCRDLRGAVCDGGLRHGGRVLARIRVGDRRGHRHHGVPLRRATAERRLVEPASAGRCRPRRGGLCAAAGVDGGSSCANVAACAAHTARARARRARTHRGAGARPHRPRHARRRRSFARRHHRPGRRSTVCRRHRTAGGAGSSRDDLDRSAQCARGRPAASRAVASQRRASPAADAERPGGPVRAGARCRTRGAGGCRADASRDRAGGRAVGGLPGAAGGAHQRHSSWQRRHRCHDAVASRPVAPVGIESGGPAYGG